MITYSKKNGNLQFWISGFQTVKGNWMIATSNLPFTKSESGEILPVKISNKETSRSIMLKAILEVSREKGVSPICGKVTIRQDGTANIVMYDVIGKAEAVELMDMIPEKMMTALEKYGFDIRRSACYDGFPVSTKSIKGSPLINSVFAAYGIDINQYAGKELPLETEEILKKKAAVKQTFNSQKRSLSQLGDFFDEE